MILSDGGIAEHTILPDAGNGHAVYAGGIVKLPCALPLALSGRLRVGQNHIAQPKLPHHLIRPGNGVLFGNAAPVGAAVILEVAVDNRRVRQISAEAVHDDDFDFTVHTVFHELLKALPMVRVRAREAVIDIAARVLPVGVLLDLFHVLLDLEVDGKGLIDIICRDAAVRGHPENPFLLRRFGGGGDHPYVSSVLWGNLFY